MSTRAKKVFQERDSNSFGTHLNFGAVATRTGLPESFLLRESPLGRDDVSDARGGSGGSAPLLCAPTTPPSAAALASRPARGSSVGGVGIRIDEGRPCRLLVADTEEGVAGLLWAKDACRLRRAWFRLAERLVSVRREVAALDWVEAQALPLSELLGRSWQRCFADVEQAAMLISSRRTIPTVLSPATSSAWLVVLRRRDVRRRRWIHVWGCAQCRTRSFQVLHAFLLFAELGLELLLDFLEACHSIVDEADGDAQSALLAGVATFSAAAQGPSELLLLPRPRDGTTALDQEGDKDSTGGSIARSRKCLR